MKPAGHSAVVVVVVVGAATTGQSDRAKFSRVQTTLIVVRPVTLKFVKQQQKRKSSVQASATLNQRRQQTAAWQTD